MQKKGARDALGKSWILKNLNSLIFRPVQEIPHPYGQSGGVLESGRGGILINDFFIINS